MTTLLKKLFLPVTKRILTDSPQSVIDINDCGDNNRNDYSGPNRNDNNIVNEKDTSRKYLFLYTRKLKSKSKKDTQEIKLAPNPKVDIDPGREKTRDQTRLEQIGLLSRGVFHDVLNPLAALSLHIDQLQQKGFIQEYELIEDMMKSKKALLCFMQQMQLLITEKILLEDFNLSKLIGDTILLIKNRAVSHNITILYTNNSNIFFKGVACKLQQVLLVVINNAIDSCMQNGRVRNYVTISVFQKDNIAHITIKDTGCGLKILKNASLEKKIIGCGIGLTHAREIIEKECGGTLFLSNQHIGVEVQMTLPISPASTVPTLPRSHQQVRCHR